MLKNCMKDHRQNLLLLHKNGLIFFILFLMSILNILTKIYTNLNPTYKRYLSAICIQILDWDARRALIEIVVF